MKQFTVLCTVNWPDNPDDLVTVDVQTDPEGLLLPWHIVQSIQDKLDEVLMPQKPLAKKEKGDGLEEID